LPGRAAVPGGRLVAGVLGSIAEFERARIQQRIVAGLARARTRQAPRATPIAY
jgi:DNA invertase Pin-like site-specific DNA recombinase